MSLADATTQSQWREGVRAQGRRSWAAATRRDGVVTRTSARLRRRDVRHSHSDARPRTHFSVRRAHDAHESSVRGQFRLPFHQTTMEGYATVCASSHGASGTPLLPDLAASGHVPATMLTVSSWRPWRPWRMPVQGFQLQPHELNPPHTVLVSLPLPPPLTTGLGRLGARDKKDLRDLAFR